MLEHLKSYISLGNRFCAIEYGLKNETPHFYATVLKKTRKELLSDAFITHSSLTDLTTQLKPHWPLVLVINNANVITKTVASQDTESNASKLLNAAFPNINTNDFYYEITKGDACYHIAICRSAYINDILKYHASNKHNVINFSLGNLSIAEIVSYSENTEIYTSNSSVISNNYSIKSITTLLEAPPKATYNINGLEVTNIHILSFAAALQNIVFTTTPDTNSEDLRKTLLKDFKNTRFFNQFLKISLISLLAILLVNFYVFNLYFEDVKTLEDTSQLNQIAKKDIKTRRENVEKSQRLAEDILKNNSSKSAFYINSITHSIPNTILLVNINYQPLHGRVKKNKPITVESNVITISGTSNSSDQFSKWITTLETKPWIHRVEVFDYSDATAKRSDFSLKLYIENE